MSTAAYNRGTRAMAREFDAIISGTRATLEARAQLWRDLLDAGWVLTWIAGDGAAVVAGPLQFAVPSNKNPTTGVRRIGGRWAFDREGKAWTCALHVIEHVGRARPVRAIHPVTS
jgi:hypothetical protein